MKTHVLSAGLVRMSRERRTKGGEGMKLLLDERTLPPIISEVRFNRKPKVADVVVAAGKVAAVGRARGTARVTAAAERVLVLP